MQQQCVWNDSIIHYYTYSLYREFHLEDYIVSIVIGKMKNTFGHYLVHFLCVVSYGIVDA